jgi:tetratricopeptide (TPR) repeat protein
MNPTEFGNRIMTILGRARHEKPILLLASILACLAILAVALVPTLIQRLQKAGIPDFPDCTGQSSAVVEYLRKAYDYALESPASDDAVGKLGMAFHAHLFYDEAGACYMRAQELNPDAWRWRYYAALIREELGDAKTAIEDLRAVVEKQPALPQAWFRLGNAYLKTQAYQDADRAFLQVLQLPESQAAESPALQLSARGAFPLKA